MKDNHGMLVSFRSSSEDRVGFWRYYFTVHMNDKINKLLPDKLKDADLEFDYMI